jgi:hypothetical protein
MEVDALVAANHLLPTPDLIVWFERNPLQLCHSSADCEPFWIGVDALPSGQAAINRLWAAAADSARLYAP